MSTENKNIVYGDKNVLPDVEFNPKDVKVKISMFLDGDVLKACKKQAEVVGLGYQTLINQKLRELFLNKNTATLEARITALEKLIVKPTRRKARKSRSKRKAA